MTNNKLINVFVIATVVIVLFGAVHRMRLRRLSVAISVESKETCALGELDALDMDLRYSNDKERILISVEPLDSSAPGKAIVLREVTRSELDSGLQIDLPPSASYQEQAMGVFLCRDSTGQEGCAGKTRVKLTEIIMSDTEASLKNPSFRAPDRIYFREPLPQPLADRRVILGRHAGNCG